MYLLDIIGYKNEQYRVREYTNRRCVAVYKFSKLIGDANELGASEFITLWQHNRMLAIHEYYADRNYDIGAGA